MNSDASPISLRFTLASAASDVFALGKPRVTVMVLVTTLGGLFMAPRRPDLFGVIWALAGTGLIVVGANALNMYLERELDGRMSRTRERPLPAGRMAPWVALAFGLFASVVALPILWVGAGPITALLAAAANASYVLLYTPLKQRSWLALLVGAVPGAMPPLLGWTAATGHIDAGGLALFGILFVWQVPHFHAIALFRRAEYARAGLKVLPNRAGVGATKVHILASSFALAAVTYAPLALGMVRPWYGAVASLLNAGLLSLAFRGLRPSADVRWARRFFALSMPYLALLVTALLLARAGG
jgi:protoheme IX farnesyltransferase